MKSPERLSGIFFILLSVIACLAALKLRIGSLGRPGPGMFPLLLSLILLFLSIILLFQKGVSSLSNFSGIFKKGELLKIIYFLGIFFFSLFIFEPMGFLVSTFILNFLFLKGLGGKTIIKSVCYGVTFSLSCYLVFSLLLGVNLPRGILGF